MCSLVKSRVHLISRFLVVFYTCVETNGRGWQVVTLGMKLNMMSSLRQNEFGDLLENSVSFFFLLNDET